MQPDALDVDARGLNLRLWRWPGPVGAPVLLLLHGFLDHGRSFAPLAARLARQWTVVAWDARGHGDSGWIAGGGYYHFQDYVYDLHDAHRAVAPDAPVVLVGHSMGGMIVSLYAGAFPERVSALVSLEGFGPPPVNPQDAPQRMRDWIEGVDARRRREVRALPSVEAAVERLRQSNPRLSESRARALVEHGIRPSGDGWVWKYDPWHRTRSPQPFLIEQAAAFWRRIEAPTLLVQGADSNFPLNLEAARTAVPQLFEQSLPGAGHMLHHDQPEALAAMLETWLANPGPRTPARPEGV